MKMLIIPFSLSAHKGRSCTNETGTPSAHRKKINNRLILEETLFETVINFFNIFTIFGALKLLAESASLYSPLVW